MSELVVTEHVASAQLAPLEDPVAFVQGYVAIADELSKIVRSKNLVKRIGSSDHVLVDAWCLLGSMLGVFPATEWTRPVLNEECQKIGWEARVVARTRDGAMVGAAEAECLRSEKTWQGREDYALRSMAQTRATSKALRQPLGFVVHLAGFNATPAEEMPQPQEDVISDAQRKRLRALQQNAGITDDQLKALVLDIAGVESSKDIPKSVYDRLCEAVEAEGTPF
jgi:hypothetical protein